MARVRWSRASWWHKLRLALYALAAGAALAPSCGSPAYGVEIPLPPESGLEIVSLEYAPASPIHVGDMLTFTVTTNRPSQLADARVFFYVAGGHLVELQLQDDGVAPDAVSSDGIWTGEKRWRKAWGTPQSGEVRSELTWANGAYDYGPGAPRITVLPMED